MSITPIDRLRAALRAESNWQSYTDLTSAAIALLAEHDAAPRCSDVDVLLAETCRLRSERDVALLERDRMAFVATCGILAALFVGVLLLCDVLS